MNHSSTPCASLDVAPVWAGHPVGFCLLTAGQRQYVAYYDQDRHLTVAARNLSADGWQIHRLPSAQPGPPGYRQGESSAILGWDSHNYIAMALDDAGHLHLSGNMHCNALTYYHTDRPLDISTFVQVPAMTGRQEDQCTYPHFLRGPGGDLLFHYRYGSSGNGVEIYNVYHPADRRWSRLLDTPLTDAQGRMNAYMHEPLPGPDGHFHLSWVWRNTPDCSTNHDLSYARSRDLLSWTTAAGEPLTLPITPESMGVVVDPVPVQGGIINGTGKIGFDSRARPLLTYHKFDGEGYTQAYCARWEEGQWVIRQLSDWRHRWYFEGGGSIENEVDLSPAQSVGRGLLAVGYRHDLYGQGVWRVDEETMQVVETMDAPAPWPRAEQRPESDFPAMQVHFLEDQGRADDPAARYFLRWETLPRNRDRPRSGPLPGPSMLRVLRVPAPEPGRVDTAGGMLN